MRYGFWKWPQPDMVQFADSRSTHVSTCVHGLHFETFCIHRNSILWHRVLLVTSCKCIDFAVLVLYYSWKCPFSVNFWPRDSVPPMGTGNKIHYIIIMFVFVPALSWRRGTLKLIHPSVCMSIKNFNLAYIFWSIDDIHVALIFGMHEHCDKLFLLALCLGLDLWPILRSTLLPHGGPQFSEFACLI